jgi:hypothetical protein
MGTNILNEITRIRKMMGLNEAEDFDLSSVDNPNAYTDDAINHNAEKEYVNFEKNYDFDHEKAAIESASGEEVVQREFDDYDRPLYWSLANDYVNYYIGDGDNGPMIIKYNAKTGERYPIGDLKDYDAYGRPIDDKEVSEIDESEISEGSMESGVYYDTTVAHEIKTKVGDLHKIAPYVLEIGDRVIEDISGKVSVYDGDNLIEKFSDVDAFLVGIKYGATPI